MKRVAIWIVCAAAATARAEERVDLVLAPDARLVEYAFPLDAYDYEHRSKAGAGGSLALGFARDGATAGAATFGAGQATDTMIVGLRSELVVGDGVRGRHRGLFELRSDWDDPLVGSIAMTVGVDHGRARGLPR